jgi:hypothetical protein
MKKNINSREDGVTKDMVPGDASVRTYHFPELGVSAVGATFEEALQKAKEVIKSKK